MKDESPTEKSPEIGENEAVSDGPDVLTILNVNAAENKIELETTDGTKSLTAALDAIARCHCGMLTLGRDQCYVCYRESSMRDWSLSQPPTTCSNGHGLFELEGSMLTHCPECGVSVSENREEI